MFIPLNPRINRITAINLENELITTDIAFPVIETAHPFFEKTAAIKIVVRPTINRRIEWEERKRKIATGYEPISIYNIESRSSRNIRNKISSPVAIPRIRIDLSNHETFIPYA